MPLVLTFDLGTQSARAMLVNSNGEIIKKVKKAYDQPYYSKNSGWAEQSAEFYWSCICQVSGQLKEESGILWSDIIAVTFTCIRDSCLCVNASGEPLRDIILWLDKRKATKLKPLTLWQRMLFRIVGMSDSVELQRHASACNWIKENEPQLWEKTYKFVFLSAYLNNKFCGKLVDSCASAIGHIPFDSHRRTWMKQNNIKRCIFDVEEDKLCELLEPGTNLGPLTESACIATGIPSGIPLILTGSDKGCETLGLSCSTPESAAISFGTTATIQITTPNYMEPLPFIPAYPSVIKDHYNPEFQIYRGYWLISWFKKEFAAKEVEEAKKRGISAEELLNARLREVPPGCNGLVFQPYFTPGVIMPKARGAIIGFSDIHSRQHIYRAIIEGINFALMDGLKTMERRGHLKIKQLFVAGGGSQSDEICQITANMFGLPVIRIQTYEASGLGSSIVAFVALGIFPNIEKALTAMVHNTDEFLPDEEEHTIYLKLFNEIFRKIYTKLFSLYRKNIYS